MVKTITKIGNSRGIILDAAILEMAHLKEGDQMNVTIHEGGAITFSPVEPRVIEDGVAQEAARDIVSRNSELFRRLSQ